MADLPRQSSYPQLHQVGPRLLDPSIPSIGLLTGGGDAPGLNAVIRAVVKSLSERGYQIIGFEDGFEGLCDNRWRVLTWDIVSGIFTQGGTILGTSNTANPFKYAKRGGIDVSGDVIELYRRLNLECLVVIGGDGSMSIANGIAERSKGAVHIVGVPKTIDNDLMNTDQTFGFETAVTTACEAMDRLRSTAQAHHRVMITETMGRYSGYIALYAGIAAGVDVALIPELDYDLEEIIHVCTDRIRKGRRYTLICIAEGAKQKGGELVVRETVATSFDALRLGGVAAVLTERLSKRLPCEVRFCVLGHTQRGGTPTPFDRILATNYGAYAAYLVGSRQFGRMVALQGGQLTSVPLASVANQNRRIRLSDPIVATALHTGVSFGVPVAEIYARAKQVPDSYTLVEEAIPAPDSPAEPQPQPLPPQPQEIPPTAK